MWFYNIILFEWLNVQPYKRDSPKSPIFIIIIIRFRLILKTPVDNMLYNIIMWRRVQYTLKYYPVPLLILLIFVSDDTNVKFDIYYMV